ncbi:hypothetical protein L915_08725 [Plasmopara halstedii]|uniref:Uncharacterized protein n=1 Tax=Plasmopara halstedii TaxID=4781 RepID=A0A0P1B228_PLAHL|nr:hypothetical protein L915_08725 [Plasmopara halstedii]CEG48062.1 hypothetical protein L915_08725 [Plasmopara halstedii]|eukprot:XP_024584431.1 hypothetical protein L915_08725 [Plasmopara halstedii]
MESMSSSEEGFEEQWDDMAIVRAFEAAMLDQRTQISTFSPSNGGKHKHLKGTMEARTMSEICKDDKERYENRTTVTSAANETEKQGRPNALNRQQKQRETAVQQQVSSDVYQAAYAQAYAHFQAQFQAAYPATISQQLNGLNAQAPAVTVASTNNPPPPPLVPPTPTPFANMPGASASFTGATSVAGGPDDGLANVLLAWYQSGYYTGRFQAMQEMKLHGRR